MDKQNLNNQAVPEVLTPQQALTLLIQGINFAQSKGVFTLNDSALLHKAVSTFAITEEPKKQESKADESIPANTNETLPTEGTHEANHQPEATPAG